MRSEWERPSIKPLPRLFVSVASKGLGVRVKGLESTLADISVCVDSKEVAQGEKDNLGTANFDASTAAAGIARC